MKKLVSLLSAAVLAVAILSVIPFTSGCLTSKQTTVTNGVTNTVTVLNQAALDGYSLLAQVAATEVAQTIVAKNPGATNVIQDIEVSLNGVISGANTSNVSQLIKLVGANNPASAAQLTALANTVSAYEQALVQKYGSTIAGQIAISFAKSINAGLGIIVPPQ